MSLLILGLVVFLGLHSIRIAAPQLREAGIARLGPGGWKGVYSLVALLGFALIVYGFGLARLDPVVIWVPPAFMKHIAFLLLLPVFPMFLSAYLPGRISTTLKHPLLASVKLWALAHLLVNGTLAHAVLFGAFLAWAVADRISAKRRPRPAAAQRQPKAVNDIIAVVAGLVLYVAFMLFLHLWLIGVSPLA